MTDDRLLHEVDGAGLERPQRFPSPFDPNGPHPLARQAAEALQERLRGGWIAPGLAASVLRGAEGGKMFGVLVLERGDGRLAALYAFSGQVAGAWQLEGFVPPVYDATRPAVQAEAESAVRTVVARLEAFRTGPELTGARGDHARVLETVARESGGLVSNARGRGLMIAFDLPTPEIRNKAQEAIIKAGLLLLTCGTRSIRFRPPLNLTRAEADQSLELLRQGLRGL